jgi:dephospho-CoA kinase
MPKKARQTKPLIIGLTGGIGSGKTTVSKLLKKLGAKLIEADKINADMLMPRNLIWRKIVKVFGKDILRYNGTIDKKKLGNIIFHDAKKRAVLEKITHPAILKEIKGALKRELSRRHTGVIVLDIPLLFEKKLEKIADKTLLVYAPEGLLIRRLKKREGLSLKNINARIKAQWPLSKKRELADIVLDNSASLAILRKKVESLWKGLTNI